MPKRRQQKTPKYVYLLFARDHDYLIPYGVVSTFRRAKNQLTAAYTNKGVWKRDEHGHQYVFKNGHREYHYDYLKLPYDDPQAFRTALLRFRFYDL